MVAEIVYSRSQGQNFTISVLDEYEAPPPVRSSNVQVSTALLKKQKETREVEAQLAAKRAEYAKRMEDTRLRREELKTKQRQLRDRIVKFEKFLKENDAKRQRANIKAQAERKLRDLKELEVKSLQDQVKDEQVASDKVFAILKDYQSYEAYLRHVVDNLPPDYLESAEPNVNDILARHQTLTETAQGLKDTTKITSAEIVRLQEQLSEMAKERNNQLLVYNSQLGSRQQQLEDLKLHVTLLEAKAEEIDKRGIWKMTVLTQTKLAIDNLYTRIKTKQNEKDDPGLREKLSVLLERILDLSDIAKEAAILVANEKAAR